MIGTVRATGALPSRVGTRAVNWSTAVVALAVALALPAFLSGFQLSQAGSAVYLALAVLSMNLLTGLNGQLSLGHAAFVGIGAYAVAILVTDHGWSYPMAFVAGAACAAVAGVVVALPALRLRGLYVALTTFGIGLVFPSLVQRFSSWTGGTGGKSVTAVYLPPPGLGLDPGQWAYVLSVLILFVCLVLVHRVKHSRAGRLMQAIRDNDIVAEGFGVVVPRVKVATFALSAALAGLAGGLFTLQHRFVSPGDFSLNTSIQLFVGMAIGGSVSIGGAVIGGIFLQYVPELTDRIGVPPIYTPVIYGAILALVVIFASDGAVGVWHRGVARLRRPKSFAVSNEKGST
ncbi:MAG TPA: branched-chain amino acid ABC transporter permease [Amycolatopsis sp.]|nr:branched-chain amino acid ABC transporter permease [Amycolatopsis sp.]